MCHPPPASLGAENHGRRRRQPTTAASAATTARTTRTRKPFRLYLSCWVGSNVGPSSNYCFSSRLVVLDRTRAVISTLALKAICVSLRHKDNRARVLSAQEMAPSKLACSSHADWIFDLLWLSASLQHELVVVVVVATQWAAVCLLFDNVGPLAFSRLNCLRFSVFSNKLALIYKKSGY